MLLFYNYLKKYYKKTIHIDNWFNIGNYVLIKYLIPIHPITLFAKFNIIYIYIMIDKLMILYFYLI